MQRCLPLELRRITDKEGQISRAANGKRGGKAYVRGCLMCRQYREKQQNTVWCCGACGVPLCKKDRGRGINCYDEHIEQIDDPVLGCFARESTYIVMPPEYRRYLPNNMADIPTLPPLNNATTPLTAEIDTMESTGVGDGVQDGSSDGDSSSDSDSSGGLKPAAAATKKRSAPSEFLLPPAVRTVSTRSQAVGDIRRSERMTIRK